MYRKDTAKERRSRLLTERSNIPYGFESHSFRGLGFCNKNLFVLILYNSSERNFKPLILILLFA